MDPINEFKRLPGTEATETRSNSGFNSRSNSIVNDSLLKRLKEASINDKGKTFEKSENSTN